MTGIKMSMDSWIPISLIQLEQRNLKPSHTSPKGKQIYICPYINE